MQDTPQVWDNLLIYINISKKFHNFRSILLHKGSKKIVMRYIFCKKCDFFLKRAVLAGEVLAARAGKVQLRVGQWSCVM